MKDGLQHVHIHPVSRSPSFSSHATSDGNYHFCQATVFFSWLTRNALCVLKPWSAQETFCTSPTTLCFIPHRSSKVDVCTFLASCRSLLPSISHVLFHCCFKNSSNAPIADYVGEYLSVLLPANFNRSAVTSTPSFFQMFQRSSPTQANWDS